MFIIMIYCIIMLLIFIFLMTFLYFVSTKSIIDREKSSPFECSFDPFESSRIPFSSLFFMIAVIILIFHVELVIIMPIIIVMATINMLRIIWISNHPYYFFYEIAKLLQFCLFVWTKKKL